MVKGTGKSTIQQVIFGDYLSVVVWSRLGDPFVSQNLRILCVSFSMTDSGLCIYHIIVVFVVVVVLMLYFELIRLGKGMNPSFLSARDT